MIVELFHEKAKSLHYVATASFKKESLFESTQLLDITKMILANILFNSEQVQICSNLTDRNRPLCSEIIRNFLEKAALRNVKNWIKSQPNF